MKKTIQVLAVMLLATVGFAQNYSTVTASAVKDRSGNLVTGTIEFTPDREFGVGGKACCLKSAPLKAVLTAGGFSLSVPNKTATTPSGVCFTVTAKDAAGNVVLGPDGYHCVQPVGGSYNFDTYTASLNAQAAGETIVNAYQVAFLPKAPKIGTVVWAIDCESTSACSTGGSTNKLQIRWNGTSWDIFSSSQGLVDPGTNGILKRTSVNTTAVVSASDIVSSFSGTPDGTKFLRDNGTLGSSGGGFTPPVTTVSGALKMQLWDTGGFFNNAKQYGTDGGGTVDDTTALQTWLNAVCLAGAVPGQLPEGRYKTTKPLYCHPPQSGILGVHIFGAGPNSTTIAPTGFYGREMVINTSTSVIPITTGLLPGSGGALSLDGVGSVWVDIRDCQCIEALNGAGAFEIMFAVKMTSMVAGENVILASNGKLDSLTSSQGIYISAVGSDHHIKASANIGGVTVNVAGGANTFPVNTVIVGALTYDGTTLRLYAQAPNVSAGAVASQATSGNLALTPYENFKLGADSSWWLGTGYSNTPMTGAIDFVRISNIARETGTYTSPNTKPTSDANTLLLLPFDNQVDVFTRGTANNGTLGNAWFALWDTATVSQGYMAMQGINFDEAQTVDGLYVNAVTHSYFGDLKWSALAHNGVIFFDNDYLDGFGNLEVNGTGSPVPRYLFASTGANGENEYSRIQATGGAYPVVFGGSSAHIGTLVTVPTSGIVKGAIFRNEGANVAEYKIDNFFADWENLATGFITAIEFDGPLQFHLDGGDINAAISTNLISTVQVNGTLGGSIGNLTVEPHSSMTSLIHFGAAPTNPIQVENIVQSNSQSRPICDVPGACQINGGTGMGGGRVIGNSLGGLSSLALSTPAAPTLTPTCSVCATSWAYKVVAHDAIGTTAASATASTAVGGATLGGVVFNTVLVSPVNGATSYDVYRTTSGGTPSSTGLVKTIAAGQSLTYVDLGDSGTGSAPSVNGTGGFLIPGNSFLGTDTNSQLPAWINGTAGAEIGVKQNNNLTLGYVSGLSSTVNGQWQLNTALGAFEPVFDATYDLGESTDRVRHGYFSGIVKADGNTAFLTSNYTNATTTFSNVTGLSFPVKASTNYKIRCDLDYQTSAATADVKVQWTGPSSPTAVTYDMVTEVTGSTLSAAVATAFSSSLSEAGTPTTATNFPLTLTLTLINGANAGTVQLQAAATGVGTITIIPGSCLLQ